MPGKYSISEIKSIASAVAAQYGVKKLALFGSYARNEASDSSDLDFVMDKGDIFGWMYAGFVEELEKRFGTHVDVLTYDSLKRSQFPDAIFDEVVLYER
jgi:predicted nucleotidyltransferase